MNFRTLTRSLIVSGIATLFAVAAADAQTSYSESKASTMLTVGVGFEGGMSLTLDPPIEWKVGPTFAYRAGINTSYPLTSTISATLGLGLDSRGAAQSWYDNALVTNTVRVNYFSLFPGFRFSAFALGVNIGLPLGGVRTWQDGSENPQVQRKLDRSIDGLKTMIEPRIGAVIPLVDQPVGWLGFSIFLGYNLNDISTSFDVISGQVEGSEVSSNTLSAHLGLTWQFGIPGTGI